jgi:archaellum component FlaC
MPINNDPFGIVEDTFTDTMEKIKTARETANRIADSVEDLRSSVEKHEVRLCLSSFKSP